MNLLRKFIVFWAIALASTLWAQHQITATVEVLPQRDTFIISQTIVYKNTTDTELDHLLLNDWNHAFSDKHSPLGDKLSDEFVRSFHFANSNELGRTTLQSITDNNKQALSFERLHPEVDLIRLLLPAKLQPGESFTIHLNYQLRFPSHKFTRYGHDGKGNLQIKDWLILPASFRDGDFLRYSNLNLHDAPNAASDFHLTIKSQRPFELASNTHQTTTDNTSYTLTAKNKSYIHLYLSDKPYTQSYKNQHLSIETDLISSKLDPIYTAITIDQIINFVIDQLPNPNQKEYLITQTDYQNNPFYGLNELPNFIRPFDEKFLFELKFLKTFIENYTRENLSLDFRKDNWIKNTIETKILLDYLDTYYPNQKMLGKISNLKILKSFYATHMEIKDQINYLYLMMARRNLDQPVASSKEELIKFNDQIAAKYKTALDIRYLEAYIGKSKVDQGITEFFLQNQKSTTNRDDFKKRITQKTSKNISWYFDDFITTRTLLDYSIKSAKTRGDSVYIHLKNKGDLATPLYFTAFKNNTPTQSYWTSGFKRDTIIAIKNEGFDKIILNHDGVMPEYNRKDNHKKIDRKFAFHKPVHFTLFKDFENPNATQIFFTPEFRYNLYDGVMPGISLSNKSTLRQPFTYDVSPFYSPNKKSLVGSGYLNYEKLYRQGNPYSINYNLLANYYHYVQDAGYLRVIPSVTINFRDPDFRKNFHKTLQFRHVKVAKQASEYFQNNEYDNYSIFNTRFSVVDNKFTHYTSTLTDLQLSGYFGKISLEAQYRKLFKNNRQFNARVFVGSFFYRNLQTNYFDFATYRPTDYLFDANFYGRSESSGFFAQQFIQKEGAFKSKLTPYANQWMATTNLSTSIWNWIEVYSDLGIIKSDYQSVEFLYDSGIRLNLVTDFFEVYFPVHSNLGWEISQPKYADKIRLTFTLDINKLSRLFTRRWF